MFQGIHHIGIQSPHPTQSLAAHADAIGAVVQQAADEAWLTGPNAWLHSRIGAAPARTASVHAQGIAHVCIQVHDGKAGRHRLEQHGVRLLADPHPLGTGFLYSYARDAEGRLIELEAASFLRESPQSWLAHVAFVTHDLPRLTAFYTALLGLPGSEGVRLSGNIHVDKIAQLDGVDVQPHWIRGLNLTLEFWRYYAPVLADPDERQTGYTHVAFQVADVARAQSIAIGFGAQHAEPETVMGELCTAVRDPDGNRLLFIAPNKVGHRLAALPDACIIDHVPAARSAYLANQAAVGGRQ